MKWDIMLRNKSLVTFEREVLPWSLGPKKDGSKTNKGTWAGVYGCSTRQKPSYSLEKYTTIFQAEGYAIKARAVEKQDTGCRNRNIYILSDSQAAIKELHKYQINSKLVWDCHQFLAKLAKHNRVQVI
jgi:hypothetical protein